MLPLFALVGACSEPAEPLTIPFTAHYGEAPISCSQPVGSAQMTDLRLYISEVQVLTTADRPVTVNLQADGRWQSDDLALLDFEDASGGCENGTQDVHDTLQGSMPAGDYRGLIFSVGVYGSIRMRIQTS